MLTVEKQIDEKEQAVSELKMCLESPDVAVDYVKCAEISEEIEKLNDELLSLYDEWESLQENDN